MTMPVRGCTPWPARWKLLACTPAQKCAGALVFPGFTPLLWQISNWPSHVVACFESPAQNWPEVDLNKGVHRSI